MTRSAIVELRRAASAALKARADEIAHLLEQERRQLRRPNEGNLVGLLWLQFNARSHDLSTFGPGALRTSPEGVEAALAVLETICAEAENAGWKVAAQPDGRMLSITAGEIRARLTVRERFAPAQRQSGARAALTAAGDKTGRGVFVIVVEGLSLTPLQIEGSAQDLQLTARDSSLFRRMQQRGQHGQRQAAAQQARWREEDLQRARAERERDAAAAEEERLRAAAAAAATQRDELFRDAAAWQQAELIRRYVAAAAAAGADLAWSAWALKVADELDPTKSSPR